MISLCRGAEVDRFLTMVEAAPHRFTQVFICSPFIDGSNAERIRVISERANVAGCGTRIITRRPAAQLLARAPRRLCLHGSRSVRVLDQLHAKIYLAVGRRFQDSILIITSANITEAGMHDNFEFGVLVRGTSAAGSQLVDIVRNTLLNLPERN